MKISSIFFTALLSISCIACNAPSQPIINNDLWTLNAPQGTTGMEQKQLIHNETTNAVTLKSTSTFTFTKAGNYKTHKQSFPNGDSRTQEYTYNDKNQITSIVDKKGSDILSETTYKYSGNNPLEITTTVVGVNNYFPKIKRYFEGDVLIKEERFDAGNNLIDLYEYSKTETVHTNYGLANKVRFKFVSTLKNGYEVKSIRYNAAGEQGSGRESELDAFGNVVTSWSLDETGARKKETNSYEYLYKNGSWVIRANKDAQDYGSGKTRTLYTRSFTGKANASVDEKEILNFLKTL